MLWSKSYSLCLQVNYFKLREIRIGCFHQNTLSRFKWCSSEKLLIHTCYVIQLLICSLPLWTKGLMHVCKVSSLISLCSRHRQIKDNTFPFPCNFSLKVICPRHFMNTHKTPFHKVSLICIACLASFSVAVNRVATYKELDNDLLKQAAFLTLVGQALSDWDVSVILFTLKWALLWENRA